MKKLLVIAVLVTPLLAFSQSRVDTMMGSYGFKLAMQPKPIRTDTIKNNIKRQIIKTKKNNNQKQQKQTKKKTNKKKPSK